MPGFSQPGRAGGAPGREAPPAVRLGELAEGGLAPAIMAIVERGVNRRPDQARALDMEVELRMEERYPPVRIVFGPDGGLVEDGPAQAPALRVSGALADLVALLVTPLLGGVPSPMNARGRAALGMLASGRVRIQGGLGLVRSFLGVIRLSPGALPRARPPAAPGTRIARHSAANPDAAPNYPCPTRLARHGPRAARGVTSYAGPEGGGPP